MRLRTITLGLWKQWAALTLRHGIHEIGKGRGFPSIIVAAHITGDDNHPAFGTEFSDLTQVFDLQQLLIRTGMSAGRVVQDTRQVEEQPALAATKVKTIKPKAAANANPRPDTNRDKRVGQSAGGLSVHVYQVRAFSIFTWPGDCFSSLLQRTQDTCKNKFCKLAHVDKGETRDALLKSRIDSCGQAMDNGYTAPLPKERNTKSPSKGKGAGAKPGAKKSKKGKSVSFEGP